MKPRPVGDIKVDNDDYWVDKIRFRPLIEKKTDISIFTAMLNKNKELV